MNTFNPTGALYALERDGTKFSAAFYQPNGNPNQFEPQWQEVSRERFYKLAESHTQFRTKGGNSGARYAIQFYDLQKQIDAQVDAYIDAIDERNAMAAGASAGVL